ncbi:hypothetical protein HYV79_03910 [Candidatus Woesearchaeota archaeon]|nr:hypothetical protein [Candidatus Woesearchaeota archaeon]
MILKIDVVDVRGKAYLLDAYNQEEYYMDDALSDIRPALEEDLEQKKNIVFLLDKHLYVSKTFYALEDARKFIARLSFNYFLDLAKDPPKPQYLIDFENYCRRQLQLLGL